MTVNVQVISHPLRLGAPLTLLVVGPIWLATYFLLGDSLADAVWLASLSFVALFAVIVSVEGKLWWAMPSSWFGLAFLLVFIAPPVLDILEGQTSYWLGFAIATTYPEAVRMGATGLMSFVFGYALMPVKSRRAPVAFDVNWNIFRSRAGRWVALTSVLTVVFVSLAGGPSAFLTGRTKDLLEVQLSAGGYLWTAPQWIFALALYAYVRGKQGAGKQWTRFGLIFLVASQIVDLALGDRSYFLVGCFAFFVASHLAADRTPRWPLIAMLLPVLVVVGVVFPRLYRDSNTVNGDIGLAINQTTAETEGDPFAFLRTGDFSMARNLAVALNVVPERLPYQGGSTYAAAIVRPIPKQLFPGGKPSDADSEINQAAIYDYQRINAGFSYTFFSEPYLNFGIPGVVLISFLWGMFCHFVSSYYRRWPRNSKAIVLLAVASSMMVVMFRGNLGTDYQRALFWVLPLLWTLRAPAGLRRKEEPEGRENA